MDVEEAKIESLEFRAKQFRVALEICERDSLPITFENFPSGSCGDATLLLAKYLQNSGLGFFDYVCGEIYEDGERKFQSHAWLQREDLIVDITADQFDEIEAAVLITRNHSWHNQFEVDVRHLADFEVYDEHTKNTLSSAYNSVVAHIDDI